LKGEPDKCFASEEKSITTRTTLSLLLSITYLLTTGPYDSSSLTVILTVWSEFYPSKLGLEFSNGIGDIGWRIGGAIGISSLFCAIPI